MQAFLSKRWKWSVFGIAWLKNIWKRKQKCNYCSSPKETLWSETSMIYNLLHVRTHLSSTKIHENQPWESIKIHSTESLWEKRRKLDVRASLTFQCGCIKLTNTRYTRKMVKIYTQTELNHKIPNENEIDGDLLSLHNKNISVFLFWLCKTFIFRYRSDEGI